MPRSPAPSLPMTLGNMRVQSVRSLAVDWWLCGAPADRWPDDAPVPSFGPAHGVHRLRQSSAPTRGPNWTERPSLPSLTDMNGAVDDAPGRPA